MATGIQGLFQSMQVGGWKGTTDTNEKIEQTHKHYLEGKKRVHVVKKQQHATAATTETTTVKHAMQWNEKTGISRRGQRQQQPVAGRDSRSTSQTDPRGSSWVFEVWRLEGVETIGAPSSGDTIRTLHALLL
ncbi:unnamed protein product [Pylaiella littoralis]